MTSDTLPYRLPALLLAVLLLGAGPAAAQDVIVNDSPDGVTPCNGGEDETDIQDGVVAAPEGGTVFVCPGTYGENVTINKSVTLEGNNAGTAGYASRDSETTIDAGTDSFTDAAFTINADDVTIDGFRFVGHQGIEVSGMNTSDEVGAIIKNNLVETNIRGVRVRNLKTTASKSFTIANNQFAIQQQLFDKDGSETAGDATNEGTSSIEIRDVVGPSDGDRPTIEENVITTDGETSDGSFYGYEIDGIKIASGPVTIAGDPNNTGNTGTIQGTAQGISVLDGESSPQSDVVLEDFSISMMSGSAPNGDINFHAGVFTYVAEERNSGQSTITIQNLSIEGVDYSDNGGDFSANILLSQFPPSGFGGTAATQTVSIEGVTIQNTEHRGIALAGGAADNINATITDDSDGANTVVKEVAEAADSHPIHSENGGSLTINNTDLTNANTNGAETIHFRDAGGSVTLGADVTIDTKDQRFLSDQSGRAADADLKITNSISLSTLDVALDGGGTVALTGPETLRATDRLALSAGTFDVSSGNLTLASTGNTSTAFVSDSGSGILTGDVTVEWQVPSGYTGWQALTAPVDAPFDGPGDEALLSTMWTQKSGSGTGYNAANGGISNSSVFDYDETASVGGSTTEDLNDAWFAPLDLSTAITQGQTGRLAYFFNDRDFDGTDDAGSSFTLSATGALLGKENNGNDVDLGLTYTKNDGGGDADGWNLVGNPFMAPLDWELVTGNGTGRTKTTRTVYIPKADGTYATYQADKNGKTGGTSTNGGSRYLSPFQGFFVKATGNSPSLTVKSDDKALNESPTLKQGGTDAAKVKLRMRAEGSSRDENTVVRFAEAARPGANDGDAYQLKPLSDDYFYIASEIPDSSQAYEIQSLPPPAADTQTVPLELASGPARTYTVGGTLRNVPSSWTVQLKDRKTGTTADLTRDETLTISMGGKRKSSASTTAHSSTNTRVPSRLHSRQPVVASATGPTSAPTNTAKSNDAARIVLTVTGLDDSETGSDSVDDRVVPVQFKAFEGKMRDDVVALSWTTVGKTKNARFHLQRSPSDNGTWKTIRVVEKASPTSYRLTDDLPYEGDTFRYRLKVDAHDSTRYSNPITVKREVPSTLRVRSIFPNPARSELTVQYALPDRRTVTLAIYDVLGRRVATVLNQSKEAGRHTHTLPVTSLSSGIHFLRLRAGSTARTQKFVVAR